MACSWLPFDRRLRISGSDFCQICSVVVLEVTTVDWVWVRKVVSLYTMAWGMDCACVPSLPSEDSDA